MKNRTILFVLLSVFVVFLINGCDESSPTESTDALTDPNANLYVVYTSPANGAVGPFGNTDPTQYHFTPQILIQFNKLINISRLAPNSISLKTGNTDIPIYWNQGSGTSLTNILLFDMNVNYLVAKKYILTIDTTLKDIYGKKLSRRYIVSYIPEPKFRVYFVYPSSTDRNPPDVTEIDIEFNSKIDTTIFSSFSISPHLDGYWTLSLSYYTNDSSTAYFSLADQPKFNTKYTVSVSSNAKDYNGLPISNPYSFSFTTAPFQVNEDTYQTYMGPNGFLVSNYFGFRFNGNVDTSTVRNSISVSPAITYNYYFDYYNSNYIHISFNDVEFQRDTKYTIHFDSTIKSEFGDALEPYSYSFTTGQ